MQATHQTSDMQWTESRLGAGRLVGAYAWRSLLETGVIIPNGSDFPVEKVDPLLTFHSAVTRQNPDNQPPGGWRPEQRMTREEALASMTRWPAYAGFQEGVMGSLRSGRYADFVVLDRDIIDGAGGEHSGYPRGRDLCRRSRGVPAALGKVLELRRAEDQIEGKEECL